VWQAAQGFFRRPPRLDAPPWLDAEERATIFQRLILDPLDAFL